ncbi:pyrimidine reductase family protein [Microbacterium sp. SD291]|uniref:pyrimidine reductase family protein n=1 Tax=Microbacterium sp. SD291 TaxID=2782007 RepID=UPI001A972029|nr:pyrimidine reductase family protein [Microbacterium sp. SD291]MBO0982036.1 pyrimidine reductase family protein [Microbacterium sp. SD291]
MTRIDRVWPDPADDLDDEALLAETRMPDAPWLRMNFISSLDGAATRGGRSGGLGDDADRRLFDLLRRPADAVLLGAGTARTEGYTAMRLDDAAAAWREARGLASHPTLVIVSRRLDLDPASAMFTDAPVRPVICTVGSAPQERRERLAEVATIIDAGATEVDPRLLREELSSRRLRRVHSEGGPTLFGSFLEADAVDALHLTMAPRLEAGAARRIASSAEAVGAEMRLVSILRAGSELLLSYRR